MHLKRSIKIVLWSLGLVAMGAALVLFAAAAWFSSSYWWDRDQWNQERIGKAYVQFYMDKTNFPSQLADLVKGGYLPESAEWYREPPGLFARRVSFKDSSYMVQPPTTGNVEHCNMIGRITKRGGRVEIDFTGLANAYVRDAILRLHEKPELRLLYPQDHTADK